MATVLGQGTGPVIEALDSTMKKMGMGTEGQKRAERGSRPERGGVGVLQLSKLKGYALQLQQLAHAVPSMRVGCQAFRNPLALRTSAFCTVAVAALQCQAVHAIANMKVSFAFRTHNL